MDELELFSTPGLGDASYLVASGGEAVLVDPQRDAWRFLAAAERRGWRIRHVLETHVHNDYVSGALETRAATGAEIVAPARGGYAFEHRGIEEGDWLEVGGLRITAMATPGHTPEHHAWLVSAADGPRGAGPGGLPEAPLAVFTGGSLLVGSAGRTDLLGPVLRDALTSDQQRSLRRLALLDDDVQVLPTHGAGSFCSAGPAGSRRVTTIGAERFANPTFALADAPIEAFRAQALGGLGRYPDYYARMAPINRQGPRILRRPPDPPALDVEAFAAAAAGEGVWVVDARSAAAFAAGHLPGAVNIELDGTFAGYVGWIVPFDAPLLLVVPGDAAARAREAATELVRIGYERVGGWLAGGVDAWAASGRGVSTYELTTMAEARVDASTGEHAGPTLLDVRQPIEWASDGVVPGASTIFVADLPDRIDDLPADGPVTVFCQSGVRAAIAASLLDRAGRDVRLVTGEGATAWPDGLQPLETGE